MISQSDLAELLRGTGDAAFAVALDGSVRIWNCAAERLFGLPAAEALKHRCFDLLRGIGVGGEAVCAELCSLRQMAAEGCEAFSFDMEVRIGCARQWVSVAPLVAGRSDGSTLIIHIIRDMGTKANLEHATRRFIEQLSAITGQQIEQLLAPRPTPHFGLTVRERAILRLLSTGCRTKAISAALGVTDATVRNHVQLATTPMPDNSMDPCRLAVAGYLLARTKTSLSSSASVRLSVKITAPVLSRIVNPMEPPRKFSIAIPVV